MKKIICTTLHTWYWLKCELKKRKKYGSCPQVLFKDLQFSGTDLKKKNTFDVGVCRRAVCWSR
jgi:hypothetical protein